MKIFRKIIIAVVSIFVFIGLSVFIFTLVGAYQATHVARQDILKNPDDYGMKYQDIQFSSSDGIQLKGWWIPNKSSKSTIIVVHGYGANRAGWSGEDKQGKKEYIDWIAGAVPLYQAGYSLLFYDSRASGESGGDKITFGYLEEKDLEGALQWVLKEREDAIEDPTEAIGVLGFSMGGNIALRGGLTLNKMVHLKQIRSGAIVAVGPTIYNTMVDKSFKYWAKMPIPFPSIVIPVFKKTLKMVAGFDVVREIDPTRYVSEISPIPVMYIQAEKDELGDVDDVKAMFKQTGEPKELIILPDALRFQHYRYPAQHPERVIEFFSKHLNASTLGITQKPLPK